HPGQARQGVLGQPGPEPELHEAVEDGGQRREVEVRRIGRADVPRDQQGDRGEDLDRQQHRTGLHADVASRWLTCQRSTYFSVRRRSALRNRLIRPVARMSAYMRSFAPPLCATSIDAPRPGTPATSSAVIARMIP